MPSPRRVLVLYTQAAQQRGTRTATHAGAGATEEITTTTKSTQGKATALPGNPQMPESLAALCSLLAHRKFAGAFVDRGGVRALLALPRGPLTHHWFARCLFGGAPALRERMFGSLVPADSD